MIYLQITIAGAIGKKNPLFYSLTMHTYFLQLLAHRPAIFVWDLLPNQSPGGHTPLFTPHIIELRAKCRLYIKLSNAQIM